MISENATDPATEPIPDNLQPNGDRVLALLNALPKNAFAFLASDRAREYVAILYVLHWNARRKDPEVQHNDLMTQVNVAIRQIATDPLREAEFNELLDQLHKWHLIGKQVPVAPNHSEWRVNWHQYWIQDDAAHVLESLERILALRRRPATWAKGRDYLRAITESIERVKHELEQAAAETDLKTRREGRRRAYADLLRLYERDFLDFKNFLSDLNKDLLKLGRNMTLDFDTIEPLVDRLQSFVQETLQFFQARGEDAQRSAAQLVAAHVEDLNDGHQLDRALHEESTRTPATDETHLPPAALLQDFRRYFDWDGGLDRQSRRIQRSAFLTTQRLREYYNALTHRGLVRELLNQRIQEAARLTDHHDEEHTVRWLSCLFPQFQVQVAPGIGSPNRPGDPPRPGRRYPYHRTQITEHKPDFPGDTNITLRQKIEERAAHISDFVETRILRGREEAQFRELNLRDLQDFKALLDAVRNDPLILGGPLSKFFRFTVHDPRGSPVDPIQTATWTTPEGAAYGGPDLTVRRRALPTQTNSILVKQP